MPVLRSSIVDSGHEPGTDVRADEEGFIVCHDGSVTDRFHRAGVPYTAAIETTTETPWPLADEINLIWIRGFIDLAARPPLTCTAFVSVARPLRHGHRQTADFAVNTPPSQSSDRRRYVVPWRQQQKR